MWETKPSSKYLRNRPRKCKEWFGKARQKLDPTQIQYMDKVDKIHVYSATEPNRLMSICYKDEQFTLKYIIKPKNTYPRL